MTWCDKLASQPTVGIQLDPFYGGNETIFTRMAPLVAKLGTPEKPEFSAEVPDIYTVKIQREDGFQYSFDAHKASVQFQHRMQFKPTSGGLPVAQLISSPKVFSSLLADATEMLIEAALLLPEASQRHIRRIGIITTTAVSADDLPPGIVKFVEYLSRPWSGRVEAINSTIVSSLREDEQSIERCIHTITKPEDEEALLTLRFDWQRVLKKSPLVSRRELDKHIASATEGALSYFEDLAVGNAFDEGA
ncbi:hypothetical protein [Rhizobium rhizophilum]|uniref:TIGR04255 family protein n=1 Tax=Rhizobium rhizophilum TaxID=1850373 RepID=A0ABY2QU95_9HYPH|nr:hypothetical protein [Rhizobium rhizophilum]THV13862.1 hypothetical protein E9677_13255 [Rhizobium rhizophilum]